MREALYGSAMTRIVRLVAARTDESLRLEEVVKIGLILILALAARALVASA